MSIFKSNIMDKCHHLSLIILQCNTLQQHNQRLGIRRRFLGVYSNDQSLKLAVLVLRLLPAQFILLLVRFPEVVPVVATGLWIPPECSDTGQSWLAAIITS